MSREKQRDVQRMLDSLEDTTVVVDVRHPRAIVPLEYNHQHNFTVTFNLSQGHQVQCRDDGIWACLAFKEGQDDCFLPWEAVYKASVEGQVGPRWNTSTPPMGAVDSQPKLNETLTNKLPQGWRVIKGGKK